MAEARAETIIAKPADEVWARIGDFGDVSWIPNTESCRVEGDVRRVRMTGLDFEVAQRLTHHDAAARTYSYCMAGELNLEAVLGPGNILRGDDLAATLAVTPKGESESLVTYDVKTIDAMVDSVHAE